MKISLRGEIISKWHYKKVSIHHDWLRQPLRKTPFSTSIFVRFVVDWKIFFAHFGGPLLPRIWTNHDRWFVWCVIDVIFWFWVQFFTDRAFQAMESWCQCLKRTYSFPSCDLAHVARCNRLWSRLWIPDVSLSVRVSIPHDCWLLDFFPK
jgi:hypothetical protein